MSPQDFLSLSRPQIIELQTLLTSIPAIAPEGGGDGESKKCDALEDWLKEKGFDVEERLLSIDELADALENGKLEEAWGCGTAAVVSPIGELCYKGVKYPVNNGEIGEVTQMLYDTLTGIQMGRIEAPEGWIHVIK